MTTNRIKLVVTAALAALFVSGCVSAGVTPIGSSSLPPLPKNSPVLVYLSEKEVNAPFKVVGIVSYTNPGKYQVLTLTDAIPTLKEQARKVGANGLIILDTRTIKSGIISTGIGVEAKAILVDLK
ncbi:MAG TPA: hypothetical protein VH595_23810 [Verrucomicrobiae bacterium]|nr:hypothetical protein [Verrucomicrobiae bacterium]